LDDRKIKLEDGFHVKVVGVKMSNDGVFLEVEEKVGDKLEYYEIMYQQDMVGVYGRMFNRANHVAIYKLDSDQMVIKLLDIPIYVAVKNDFY
jgi:hypothetical protein